MAKKILTFSIIFFATLLFVAIPANAAPAYVQGKYGECTGTSCSVSLNQVTPGNLLVAVLRDGGIGKVPTCTSGGRTFTLDDSESYEWTLAVLSLPNAAGGSTSVSCTYSQSTDQIRMTILEFSGVAASFPKVDTATNSTSGVPSAGPVTTTSANNLLLFAAASDGDSYHTVPQPGSGYTLIDLWSGSASDPDKTAEEWRVAATAGNYNGAFATVSANPYCAVLVAYKPADSGGPGSDTTPPSAPSGLLIQ
jgi:hypothetical protein